MQPWMRKMKIVCALENSEESVISKKIKLTISHHQAQTSGVPINFHLIWSTFIESELLSHEAISGTV